MFLNKKLDTAIEEILDIDKLLAVSISTYDGLIIFEKGAGMLNGRKFSVEMAKIAKSVKSNLPNQTKKGIISSIYFEKNELLIGFMENFIISSLCERNVNMGILKIRMKEIIPQIEAFL